MKKILLIILSLVLVLLGTSLTACGKTGINNTIHIPDSEGGGDIEITGLAGGDKTPEDFGDIPIYPGCVQLAKVTAEEEMNGQPGIFDHRIYSTSDSVEKVVAFYKDKMPANGWTEDSWYEGTANMGSYSKGESSVAVISVVAADTEGGAMLTIDKKYQK